MLLLICDWFTPLCHCLVKLIGWGVFYVIIVSRHQVQLRKDVALESGVRLTFLWTGKAQFVSIVSRFYIEWRKFISDDWFRRGVVDCYDSFHGPSNVHFIFRIREVTNVICKEFVTFRYLTMSWWFLQRRWSRSGSFCCCSATLVLERRYIRCPLFLGIWPLF